MSRPCEEGIRQTREEIEKIVTRAIKLGGWKKRGVISKIGREFNLSRPTVYKIRDCYPTPPKREPRVKQVIPKYVAEFEESEFMDALRDTSKYWKLNQKTGELELTGHATGIKSTAREGWKLLNFKDPTRWIDEDYKTLFSHPALRDAETGKIYYDKASDLLNVMRISGRYDILQTYEGATKGLKRRAKKRHWYLAVPEIASMINVIYEPDTLVLFMLGIISGARWDALGTVRTDKIHYDSQIIEVYESKIGQWVEKLVPVGLLEFLRQYIRDYQIRTKLFPSSYSTYKNRLVEAGEKAEIGISKRTTLHILKHTFVTQASLHGVSLDTISEVVKTDAGTLMKYYFGAGLKKQRSEILGEKLDYKPWYLYVKEDLVPMFVQRYNQIKPTVAKLDGFKPIEQVKVKVEKKKKVRRRRQPPIKAMKASLKSDKVDPKLKAGIRRKLIELGEIKA